MGVCLGMMFPIKLSVQVLFVLSLLFEAQCEDAAVEANLGAIKNHEKIFKDVVKEDLKTIGEEFDKFVGDLNTEMDALRDFVEKTIKEIEDHAKKQREDSDKVLEENIKKVETGIKDMFASMNTTMMANLETLNKTTREQRDMTIDWIHMRNHLQEDIMKTNVALCAYSSHHHSDLGEPVTYYNHPGEDMDLDKERPSPPSDPEEDSDLGGYVDDKLDWMVFNQTCPNDCCKKKHKEACAMEVLNRETGVFKVPVNASGLYMFSFGITMDVRDFDWPHSERNEYQFRKNGVKVDGVSIYADAAENHRGDRLPGSMTVLLQLEEGDEVDVVQTRRRESNDIDDYDPTFCGTLLHLEKASESPGGLLADSYDPSFPLVEKPEMKGWNYTAPKCEDFQKGYKEFTAKTTTPSLQTIENTVRIPSLKADNCTLWLGSTQNDVDGECHRATLTP